MSKEQVTFEMIEILEEGLDIQQKGIEMLMEEVKSHREELVDLRKYQKTTFETLKTLDKCIGELIKRTESKDA